MLTRCNGFTIYGTRQLGWLVWSPLNPLLTSREPSLTAAVSFAMAHHALA